LSSVTGGATPISTSLRDIDITAILENALARLRKDSVPEQGTSIATHPGTRAAVSRALPLGNASTYHATRQVNTQTSTVRQSTSTLGLDLTSEAASTIQSTAQINTAATSYEEVSMSFLPGEGTSIVTLSGVYSGTGLAASATSLTFLMRRNATLSSTASRVVFDVKDQNGTVITSIDDSTIKAGTAIYLGADIGLTVSFGAGTLSNKKETATAVSNSTPTDVNPAATFNAADLNLRPRFENAAQVAAGSFTVNGTSVSVLAGDSINSVLSRINSTVSGISATFAGDRVTLSTTSAVESDIVLADDTSGFLAAVKLAAATTVRGDVHDDIELLKDSSRFGAVATGSFNVNGVAISVNRDTDTLQSVMSRVTASGAGVTAAFDADTNKVVFTPNTAGTTLVIDGDTSGFLSAANVQQGAVGLAVNADAAFNGTGLNSPLFDPGMSVTAGEFFLNGTRISVNADDTINAMMSRITNSDAGVKASYDPVAKTVFLTNKTVGASPLTLSGDTSGFLAAVKLDETAEYKLGNLAVIDIDAVLRDQPVFSSVQSGAITINGQTVNVSPGSSTLRGIVSAMNALSDVKASLNTSGGDGSFILSSSAIGGTLVVADTSGLLDALSFSTGSYKGTPATEVETTIPTGRKVLANPGTTATDVAAAIRALNPVLSDPATAQVAESALRKAIVAAFGSSSAAADNGISLARSTGQASIKVDEGRLTRALQNRLAAVESFLAEAAKAATAATGPSQQSNGNDTTQTAPASKEIDFSEELRALSRNILYQIRGTRYDLIDMITPEITPKSNSFATTLREDADNGTSANSFAQPSVSPLVRNALGAYSYSGREVSPSTHFIFTA